MLKKEIIILTLVLINICCVKKGSTNENESFGRSKLWSKHKTQITSHMNFRLKTTTDKRDNKKCGKDTILYSDGNIKEITHYSAGKRNGYSTVFFPNQDTLRFSLFKNDTLVFDITYDSIGNKISDFRKVFYYFVSHAHHVGDTVNLIFYIKGPDSNKMIPIGDFFQIEPKISRNIITKTQKTKSGKYSSKFIPQEIGTYVNKIGFIETNLMQNVGADEVVFDVER